MDKNFLSLLNLLYQYKPYCNDFLTSALCKHQMLPRRLARNRWCKRAREREREWKCCILAFDPAKNATPRWCTGRRWHILMAIMRGNRVGENWLTKWDEEKKFPWCTHRLMHRKRVTCELHDNYFRLMTIKHAISKIE